MIIKEKFSLIKDVPNILNISKSEIDNISIDKGYIKLYTSIKLIESRIIHFSKDKTYSVMKRLDEGQKRISIVSLKNYPLVVGYNKPTKTSIINVSYFGTDDVTIINSKDLYTATVYALIFYNLITYKKIKENYANVIINFFISIFVRIFGREYGLLGSYSKEIVKIKFLLSCYILKSFFDSSNIYKKAYSFSGFDYKDYINDLNKFDFSNIIDFIDSLNKLNALPGINKYKFSSTFLKFLSLNFIPALEDLSRFISIMTISSISGGGIIPTHIRYYNKTEFDKIIEISKRIY